MTEHATVPNERGHSPPRVGIGLPVFDGERYLAEAIESVLAQTYGDLELVISDNASTDGTEEICRAYARADPRIVYHRNESNLGGAPNYNRCLELSSATTLFKWIAHDDVIAPAYLEACVAALDTDPGAALSFPATVYIDEHGDVIGVQDELDLSLRDAGPGRRVRRLARLQRGGTDIYSAIFGLMRREAIDKTRLHGSYIGSDQVMLLELALAGRWLQVPGDLSFRRVHADAAMAKHRSPAARARWYDSSARKRFLLPHWTLFAQQYRAAFRAEVSWSEKLRAFGGVSYRVAYEWRNLGGDVKLVLAGILRRTNVYSAVAAWVSSLACGS